MDFNSFSFQSDSQRLNHGASGGVRTKNFKRFLELQALQEDKGIHFADKDYSESHLESRKAFSKLLDVETNELAIVPNVSFGLAYFLNSFFLRSSNHEHSRKEILLCKHRYRGLDTAWEELANQGFKLVEADLNPPFVDEEEIIASFRDKLSENTALVFFDHIVSPLSLTLPAKRICQEARKFGALSLIDGAHACGQININISDIDCDFYLGNTHKWLCGPKSSGFLFSKPAHQNKFRPLVFSWASKFPGATGNLFIDSCLWMGMGNLAASMMIPDLVDDALSEEFSEAKEFSSGLARKSHESLSASLKKLGAPEAFYRTSSGFFQQMFSLPLPPCDLGELKKHLFSRNIDIAGFSLEAEPSHKNEKKKVPPPSLSALRVSVQSYNSEKDILALDRALKSFFNKSH